MLLCANASRCRSAGVQRTDVSAEQLREACEREFPSREVLLMAAAVAARPPRRPRKRSEVRQGRPSLPPAPTADILAGLGERRLEEQTLVGFAAEHGPEGMAEAEGKLAANTDALVVNDISREDIGLDVDANEVMILTAHEDAHIERLHVPRTSKESVADAVLDAVERLRNSR